MVDKKHRKSYRNICAGPLLLPLVTLLASAGMAANFSNNPGILPDRY